MAPREHVVQHPPSANKDTEAQRGKSFNFLKVKLCGMGGGDGRIWCLFHQHMRGLEKHGLIWLEPVSISIFAEGATILASRTSGTLTSPMCFFRKSSS